ncbi:MAG: SusD/RagB family nutrient-binding outer membrane lipoprotein [Bacteroidetes bacterium]|nr:SusD/RagB family nutrient-binding outer membrane lipoprotein [Bacteroidota bacterium]MBS1539597.1 SusD/RagB family nutrient-binding outer membrane lipoprotein [Bacteroidota bacterium]
MNINTNPNAPSTTVPDPVLSGALVATAFAHTNDAPSFSAYWAGYWAASGTYSLAGNVTQNFRLLNTSYQGIWTDLYLNAENYMFVESATRHTPSLAYYVAISKIMRVYDFHTLVDCYGNVPYTKSLQGFKNLTPSYDVDQTIYNNLLGQLDSAVLIIKTAQGTGNAKPMPATTDVMFGGNMNNWIALANTMRLRLLLRQSAVSAQASFITSEIAKLVADGAQFLTADATINPGYQKSAGLQNPLWEANGLGVGGDVGNRDFNRTSAYSLSFFQTNNDPRVDYFFRSPGDAPGVDSKSKPYFSIPWGTPPTTAYVTANTSGMGIGVLAGPNAPVTFLSAAESYFLQAEAAFRGWLNAGSQQTLYQQGITASFTSLGVPNAAAAASTYYTSGKVNVDWSASTDKLQAIIVQKWAANTSINPMESWCDYRRTGFPNNLPTSLDPNKLITSVVVPIRLLYPQTELNVNASNVPSLPNNAQFTSKIFWQP